MEEISTALNSSLAPCFSSGLNSNENYGSKDVPVHPKLKSPTARTKNQLGRHPREASFFFIKPEPVKLRVSRPEASFAGSTQLMCLALVSMSPALHAATYPAMNLQELGEICEGATR